MALLALCGTTWFVHGVCCCESDHAAGEPVVFVECRDTKGPVLPWNLTCSNTELQCALSHFLSVIVEMVLCNVEILLLSISFNEVLGARLNYYQQTIQFLVCSRDAQPHTSLLCVAELSAPDREAKSAFLMS